jgi:alkaline phosphatase D
VSSPLAQATGASFLDGEPEMRIRPPWFRTVNFGLLDFTWEPEPAVSFTLRDLRGDRVWEPVTLMAAELKNGVSSWPAKIGAQR